MGRFSSPGVDCTNDEEGGMSSPAEIVERYLEALYAGRPEARALLAEDFHFSGPAAHFHGADAFIRATGHAARTARSVEIEKLFSAGSEVAAFYVLHLDHRVTQIRIAERFRVEQGRIASSTMVMDTAPFLPGSGAARQVAIDPVCRMEVDKAAPAATREHEGTTYYFCSTGCAESFERHPAEYLDG